MTDKEAIKAEIERMKRWNDNVRESTRHMTVQEEDYNRGKNSSYLELLSFIDSLPEEPVSEGLEEVIDKYLDNGMALRLDWKQCDITFKASQLIKFAIYIAQWQKRQMMKESKSGVVTWDLQIKLDEGGWFDLDPKMEMNPSFDVKEGDKVKILIIK